MPRFVWLSLALGLAACPHAAPTAAPPAPAPAIDAGPAVETPAVDAAPPPITADECGAYVDHVLAVALGAMRGTRAADEIPTSEQVAAIRAKLVASAPCRELDRAAWTCAMAAVDQAALYACAGPTASAAGAPASDAR